MIRLLNESNNLIPFVHSKFPDGTSQAWQFSDNLNQQNSKIIWHFEDEAEFTTVLQIVDFLLESDSYPRLIVPFLPYGRQDKDYNGTFALRTFVNTLAGLGLNEIITFDQHSSDDFGMIKNVSPYKFFQTIIKENHFVVFPDEGAKKRYKKMITNSSTYAQKVRNQITGEIEGLELVEKIPENMNILMIDDLVDGGRTFIELATVLKPYNPKSVELAVSHGIFSKGKQILLDNGIDFVYTTNSLLKNPNGYNVLPELLKVKGEK